MSFASVMKKIGLGSFVARPEKVETPDIASPETAHPAEPSKPNKKRHRSKNHKRRKRKARRRR